MSPAKVLDVLQGSNHGQATGEFSELAAPLDYLDPLIIDIEGEGMSAEEVRHYVIEKYAPAAKSPEAVHKFTTFISGGKMYLLVFEVPLRSSGWRVRNKEYGHNYVKEVLEDVAEIEVLDEGFMFFPGDSVLLCSASLELEDKLPHMTAEERKKVDSVRYIVAKTFGFRHESAWDKRSILID